MSPLCEIDLEDLAVGAAVLGSGGGGNPAYDLLMAKEQFQKGRPVALTALDELKESAVVVPVAFMGAPLVCVEKIPSGREFDLLLDKLEERIGKKVTHLVAAEIGGANAFTPLAVAARRGVQVLDADTIGRAFPELQMSSCNLYGINPCPAHLVDAMGNYIALELPNPRDLERFCRRITIEMGSSAALCAYVMDGTQAQQALIPGSVSRAISIGREMRRSSKPIANLVHTQKGKLLCEGIIAAVDQRIIDGFLRGTFTVFDGNAKVTVHYQNEFLLAEKDGVPMACTPDILIPLESETATPVTSEALQYGLRVSLIALPAPQLWRTEKGLGLVGPAAFGYQADYNRIKV